MNPTLPNKFSTPTDAKLWAQIVAMAPFVFQVSRTLRNLGVLKAIDATAEAGITFTELQAAVDLAEYNLSVLLDGGESSGILFANEGRYRLTPAGQFIQHDRLTNINMNFTHDICYQGLFSLEESIRSNRPEGLKVFGQWNTIYEGLTQLPEKALQSWLEFDHYFSDDAFPKVLPILFRDSPRSVLDVGGNTGKFAVACTKYNPDVRMMILDHPAQLKLAFERAIDVGVSDRVAGQPINLLDHSIPLPKGFDVVWMSQFLDCMSKEDIGQMLKRAADALTPESHLFIMESFIDRQKYEASKFCLDMTSLYFTCMANGNSRMYRATDFYELLEKSGLEVTEEFGPIRLSQTILKCRLKTSR